MKQKVMITIAAACLIGLTARAGSISWLYLADMGGGYTDGWLIELWEDVNKDNVGGWYDSLVIYDSHVSGSDDAVATAGGNPITTTLIVSAKGAGTYWGDSFNSPGGDLALSDDVFTVVYNSTNFSTATQYQIVDASPYGLPATDIDISYSQSSVSGGWHDIQAIPEPFTLGLLGVGMASIVLRRGVVRKKR